MLRRGIKHFQTSRTCFMSYTSLSCQAFHNQIFFISVIEQMVSMYFSELLSRYESETTA